MIKNKLIKIIEILKKYPYDKLVKKSYFEMSLMIKDTDEKLLKEYYPQFNRIKLIALRQRENKPSNYDIYYETDGGYAIIFAIDINKTPPILINAFQFRKNLKNFISYILKKYKNQMI